jgi:hypothetical protein
MKIQFVLFLLILSFLQACIKAEDEGSVGLTGTWKLSTIACSDPADIDDVKENYTLPIGTSVILNFSGRNVTYQVSDATCTPATTVTFSGPYKITNIFSSNGGIVEFNLSGTTASCLPPITETSTSLVAQVKLDPDALYAAGGMEWLNSGGFIFMDLPSRYRGDPGVGTDAPAIDLDCIGKFIAQ